MRRRLATALDKCLALLQEGESLEDCLQRFPRQRDELSSLLRTALAVRAAFARPTPSPERLAGARARVMTEAERRRRQELAPKPTGRSAWASRLQLSRGWATAALTLIFIVSILGGASIASAKSLPGDALYGVKRASENVRLLLTTDADRREVLQRQLVRLRVSEVKQVVEQKRAVDVDFSGRVERVEGDTAVVDGIVVRLSSELPPRERPVTGAEVKIQATTRDDGSVEAKSLAVLTEPTPAPTSQPEQRPSDTPTIEPTPKPSATPEPTSTATSEPTHTSLPTEAPTITRTATLTESSTTTPSDTPTVTETPAPTNTPLPPPRDIKVRIEGRIDEIAGDHWTVGGKRIGLGATTHVNQDRARAEVGGWAVVDAIKKPDGSLVADAIVVLRGAERPPQPKEFSGIIESIGSDRWVIAGRDVLITSSTSIEGSPEVGALAHVKAEQYSDGRLVAKSISIESRQEQIVQFEGIIQSISSGEWMVAGQRVLIGAETQIEGKPTVGAIAEVEAVVQADGSKLARYIKVSAPAPPEPTATPEATPTPEPTATSVPTMKPEALPSLEPTATPLPPDTPPPAEPAATETPTPEAPPGAVPTPTFTSAPEGPTTSP